MIPQSIFKLHPDYDAVLLNLLKKDPLVSANKSCQPIFWTHTNLLAVLHQAKLVLNQEPASGWIDIYKRRLFGSGADEAVRVFDKND